MKAKWAVCVTLILFIIANRLPARQSATDRASFEDTKAKAEKGDAMGQLYLGLAYDAGSDVAQDFNEAVKWYRKSADQGNAIAQLMLAQMYFNG